MKTYLIFLFTFLTLALSSRVEIGGRTEVPEGWSIDHKQRAALHPVEFTVFLKLQKLYLLEEKFNTVSDPDHADYGKFLTQEEAESLIAPSHEDVEAVYNWLRGFSRVKLTRFSDRITVKTNAMVAQKILGAEFKMHHDKHGNRLLRAHGRISVPEDVHKYIHFVAGATELITSKTSGRISTLKQKPLAGAAPITVTPQLLRKHYNMPEDLQATSPKTVNGIAAFEGDYSHKGLEAFIVAYNIVNFTKNDVIIDKKTNYGNSGESNLDVQYISALAQGADLVFLEEGNGYWILQFLVDAQRAVKGKKPTVYSISYGWFELDQCVWGSVECAKLGYSGAQYVNRTDTMFQMFGTTGVSVFIADGDDGSPSYNCPIVSDTTQCAQLTVTYQGNTCVYPALSQRQNQPGCTAIMSNVNYGAGLQKLYKQNPRCKLSVGFSQMQSDCTCDKIKPVTFNGITFSGYSFNLTYHVPFAPIWPGSSPYVTSVSATWFNTTDGVNFDEVLSDGSLGAPFTTGGGFSYFQNQPSYQKEAVQSWLAAAGDRAPPAEVYNSGKRGYPDIAFNGNNYDVYGDATDHGGESGTSASSPASAGLFNMVNDALLAKGKTPLGFLNPLLYKMAKEQPSTFNDLTFGSNKCDFSTCCKWGYEATTGWDPASGLGTPNFGEILKYVLKLKGVSN